MATNVYTTDYTVAAVRRRGLIPSTGRLTTADLIGFVNDATQDYIAPLLMASKEGFLHVTEHTAISGSEYAMPKRASSERLVRIALVNSTSASPNDEYVLNRVETHRRDQGGEGFELVDNTIVLRNVPTYSYLRVVYFCEPNRLVPLADACKVSSFTSTTVTVDDIPSTFSTSEPVDFISGTAGFRWKAIDKTPTNVNQGTNVLTFAAGVIPSTLAAGDYIALAGETPIVQIPKTLRPLVEQSAVCLALEALGDGRLAASQKTLMDMEQRLVPTLSPRVTGAPRVIINRFSGARRRLPYPFR